MSNFKVGITVGGAAPYPQPPGGTFSSPKNARGSIHKTNSILYKRPNSISPTVAGGGAAAAAASNATVSQGTPTSVAAPSADSAVRNATYPLTKNRGAEFGNAPLKPAFPNNADSQLHGSSRSLHNISSNAAGSSSLSGGPGSAVDMNRSAANASHGTSNNNSMSSVHMDFSPASEDRVSAGAGNAGSGSKRTAWKCSLCGYYVVAMDQNGEPLPITLSAYRKPLPMSCPRCSVTHTMWEQACPFDAFGDYITLRSRLSNTYMDRSAVTRAGDPSASSLKSKPDLLGELHGAASQSGTTASQVDTSAATTPRNQQQQQHPLLPRVSSTVMATTPPPRTAEEEQAFRARNKHGGGSRDPRGDLPAILENIGKVSYRVGTAKPAPAVEPVVKQARMMAYYCAHCGRRLMRMGPNGDLIPLPTDTEGKTRPVTCPGCQLAHTDWEARLFSWAPE